jgi:hypothetical protein
MLHKVVGDADLSVSQPQGGLSCLTAKEPRHLMKPEDLTHDIEATDNRIDALVYELYGLTDDEIRLVENGV